MNQVTEEPRGRLFTFRSILVISAAFIGAVALVSILAQGVEQICRMWGVAVDVSDTWPLSICRLMIPGLRTPIFEWCYCLGILLLFFLIVHWFLRPITARLPLVLLVGFLLVLCTNLIHGANYGLVDPHRGPFQYYSDARQVTSAARFLREFEAVQPELSRHSRTHPPGAVLFIYGLSKIVGHPAAISLVIAALAVGLSGTFLYGVLSHEFGREMCGYVTLLFLLVPSSQIYYCTSLDAVIAACFLGVLLFLRHPNTRLSIAGAVAGLFCASFLTFAACFLVPVMVGLEIATRRSVGRSAVVVLGVGMLYVGVYLLWGFNYSGSFKIASVLENPGGFLLFAEPLSYLMTRLENVADIIVFFGPFLLVLFVRGMRTMRQIPAYRTLLTLTNLAVLTLLAMFLTGAFRTGETARACLFIYPYLMFPVAAYLEQHGRRDKDKCVLLWLVFGQSLAMQTLVGWFW